MTATRSRLGATASAIGLVISWAATAALEAADFAAPVWMQAGYCEHHYSLDVSADGTKLVAGGNRDLGECGSPGLVRLWDARSGEVQWTVPLDYIGEGIDDNPVEVEFSPSGDRVMVYLADAAYEGYDQPGLLLDSATGERIAAFPLGGERTMLHGCAFVPGAREGVSLEAWYDPDTNSWRDKIIWFSTEEGAVLITLEAGSFNWVSPAAIRVCRDGLLYVDGNDPFPGIRFWDLQTGVSSAVAQLGIDFWDVHRSEFGPQCSRLLTIRDQVADLWSTDTGEHLAAIGIEEGGFLFSGSLWSNGDLSMVCGVGQDSAGLGFTRVWDANSRKLLRELHLSDGSGSSAAFSPDGMSLYTSHFSWPDGAYVTKWDIRDIVARPRFVLGANGPEVHWDLGTLQFAPSVEDPWTDLPAASPFPLSPIGQKGFFRVKVEP